MDTNSLAYTKWECKYHIVFAPKYRRQVIYKDIKADVGQILGTLCRRKGIETIEAECCSNHIHMLVRILPKYSVSEIVGYLKGKSSLMISDILAAAAINACNRFHLRVPEDVMVMGFDNVDICTMIRPSITTVSQPKFQLGYTASEILIDLLHNSNTNARNLLLSTELIIRESATSLGNEIASPTSKT